MSDDDLFADLVKDIEVPDFPPDTVNVRELSDLDLSAHLNDVRDQLLEIGEMMHPTTEKGRALHSIRAALLIESRRRGW